MIEDYFEKKGLQRKPNCWYKPTKDEQLDQWLEHRARTRYFENDLDYT